MEVDEGGARKRKQPDGAAWQAPKSRADRDAEARALALYRAGEHAQAITILMDLYAAPLVAVIRRSVNDAELAKDIRQIVFLEALRDLAKFEGRSSVWSWLCGIADHRSIDARRQARSRGADKQASSEVLDQLPAPIEPTMDHDHAMKLALEDCLQKLPEGQRAEVTLRYKAGLRHQEIAEIRNKKAGTVQVNIARGITKLKECMKRKGVGR